MGHFVMGHFVMGHFVMGHFVMGNFVMGQQGNFDGLTGMGQVGMKWTVLAQDPWDKVNCPKSEAWFEVSKLNFLDESGRCSRPS